jgi:methionine synthase II (cobalamin-independent)
MKTSENRILTTHVGSLPRSKAVTDVVFAREHGEALDEDAARGIIREAVQDVVRRQAEAGVDLVSDGEMSKISYATYIKDRITGFAGDSPRQPPKDLEEFPGFLQRQASSGGTPSYSRPCCVGDIRVKDMGPVGEDIANFHDALDGADVVEGFMNAASPGVIALFQPNRHYPDHETYLEALAEAMRPEYEAIAGAGLVLQLDSPDLGLGRHMMFKDKPDKEYQRLAALHVEALNHADVDGAADCAAGPPAGPAVRVVQSPPRPRMDGVPRRGDSGRQDPGTRCVGLDHQFRGASRAGCRAHLPLCRHRRPRARHRRNRLRLLDLCGVRGGRPGYRLCQAGVDGGRRPARQPATVALSQVPAGAGSGFASSASGVILKLVMP